MKLIPLTQGRFAQVDDADYEWVSQFKWCLHIQKRKYRIALYAKRHGPTISGKQTIIWMHRFILGCAEQVDHHDSDGLNNQRHNLRPATQSLNNANNRKKTGANRFKGTCWYKAKKKWHVRVKKDGVTHHVGYFNDEFSAATAYNVKALELFGDFARFNEPLEAAA